MRNDICKIRVGLLLFLLFIYGNNLFAQRISVATNLLGYINFGTLNAEVGLGVSQHISIYMQGKYNPFEYKGGLSGSQINNKQLSVALGCRYWPWHNHSGWFMLGHIGYVNYNRGGIISKSTYEGDAYGITVGAGYALMLNEHLNLDFGAGVMGGYTDYTKYRCPSCGKIETKEKKMFLAPNNLLVQLSYLF